MRLNDKLVIFLLAFFSGVSALIYQLVWIYELQLIIGVSAFSVALVFATFFTGIALGSHYGGNYCDGVKSLNNLYKIYGILQLAIAFLAIIVPWILEIIIPGLSILYNQDSNLLIKSMLKGCVSVLIMFLPSALIGASLPVLVKINSARKGVNRLFSKVYFLNTLGGAFGAFIAGFFLFKHYGIFTTLIISVLFGIIIGVLSIIISSKHASNKIINSNEKNSKSLPKNLLFLFFISGFIVVSFEIIWSRLFSLYFFGTTYAVTIMLSTLLLGFAIGSYFVGKKIIVSKNPLKITGFLFMIISISTSLGLLMAVLINSTGIIGFNGLLPLVTSAIILLFIPSICFGFSFAFLGEHILRKTNLVGKSSGLFYSINTIGGVLGSLICAFILLPKLGLNGSFILLIILLFLSGIFCLKIEKELSKKNILLTILFFAFTLFFIIQVPNQLISFDEGFEIVYNENGITGTVSVLRGYSGEREGVQFSRLLVDNQVVAADTPVLALDSKILAHLPLLLHDNPKVVSTIGYGSGGTSYSMLKHSGVERLDAIEIEERVVEASEYFETLNEGVLEDERLNIIIEDARAYFTLNDNKYDVIVTDVTNLKYKRNSNLYTKEYFEILKSRVNDDGIVAAWVPISDINEDEQKILMNTFREVFNEMYVWYAYNKLSHFFVFIGVDESLSINYGDYSKRFDEISLDAEKVGLTKENILLGMIFDSDAVDDYVNKKIHSDDYPILSFPIHGFEYDSFGNNLNSVLERRTNPLKIVQSSEIELESLSYELNEVRDPLIKGHISFLNNKQSDAAKHYKKAIEKSEFLETIDIG